MENAMEMLVEIITKSKSMDDFFDGLIDRAILEGKSSDACALLIRLSKVEGYEYLWKRYEEKNNKTNAVEIFCSEYREGSETKGKRETCIERAILVDRDFGFRDQDQGEPKEPTKRM